MREDWKFRVKMENRFLDLLRITHDGRLLFQFLPFCVCFREYFVCKLFTLFLYGNPAMTSLSIIRIEGRDFSVSPQFILLKLLSRELWCAILPAWC